mmetsp:Transcript_45050/g.82350  ORF Transcript_45050/g.82350 Transcript_45050/m.82350 type:complete len:214 (+) Transcript_45050:74-715(+)
MSSSATQVQRTENGLPITNEKADMKMMVFGLLMQFVMGQVTAWPIYFLGAKSKYDWKIEHMVSNELGLVYLALWLINLAKDLVIWNAMLNRHKGSIMQPNMYGYKVMVAPNQPAMPYVLMEEEGDVGRANRGQRGIDNLMEYMPLYLAFFFAVGYVFPFVMFINACFFCVSRILYAVKYVQSKEARFAGFMPFVICKANTEGLALLIAIKALL